MKRFRVKAGPTAPLRLNLGDVAELTAKQLEGRANKVEVKKKLKDGAALVHVNQTVEFKAGEVLGLPDELPRRISTQLEEVDADGKLVVAAAASPPPPPAAGTKT